MILHLFSCCESCTARHQMGLQSVHSMLCGSLPRFGLLSFYRNFLKQFYSFILSNKKVKGCSQNLLLRGHAGGVITGTKRELPAGPTIAVHWQHLSRGQGVRAGQHTPESRAINTICELLNKRSTGLQLLRLAVTCWCTAFSWLGSPEPQRTPAGVPGAGSKALRLG